MRNQFSILSLIVFIATVAFLSQQSNAAVVTIIDNFTPDTTALTVTRPSSPIAADGSQITNGNDTLGTERDLSLHVDAISVRAPVNAYLLDGLFNIAFASGTSGYGGIQYDGIDGTTTLSFGLGDVDLTQDLSAYAFTLSVQADHPTTFTINVYTSASLFSSFNFVYTPIDPEAFVDLVVPFTQFVGNVNFQQVNAIELYINATTTVGIDAAIEIFGLFGYQIEGNVFLDCSGDGIQNNGETAFIGATATLRQGSNNIDTTTTDSNGIFDFFGVVNGTYQVCITNSIGATPTLPSTGCTTVTLQNAIDVFGLSYGFTIPTTLTAPVTANIECGSCTDDTAECVGAPIAAGCSGTPSISFFDVSTQTNCPRVVTRTFRSGNAVATQTININDTTIPTITTQAQAVSTPCGAANPTITAWVAAHGNANATDCTTITWTSNFNGVTPTTCTIISVTFTATDACGNRALTTATYSLTDSTGPTISPGASNQTAQCNINTNSDITAYQNWLTTRGGASATDLCTTTQNILWTNDAPTQTPTHSCDLETPVIFTATDSCGNPSTTSAIFTIEDTTNPTFTTVPQSVTAFCNGTVNDEAGFNAWLNGHASAVATDNCATSQQLVWSNNFTIGGQIPTGCAGSATVLFTVTDPCGRNASGIATYRISSQPGFPQLTNPASPLNIDCTDPNAVTTLTNWLSTNGGANATDPCTGVSWTNDFNTLPTGNCASLTVTFTACNLCNPASCISTTSTLSIVDNAAPTFVRPPSSPTVDCDAFAESSFETWLATSGNASAIDNCTPSPNIRFVNDWPVGAPLPTGCNNAATVRFTAIDACGRQSSPSTGVFTIKDNTPPTITQAQNISVECSNSQTASGNQAQYTAWLNAHANATGSDICGNITWTNNGAPTITPGCNVQRTVTFTATDSCSLSSRTTATFIITDTTSPIITRNATDQTVQCSTQSSQQLTTWLTTQGSAQAVDSCTPITWSNNFVSLSGDCAQSALVVFTASDACGHAVTTQATFTVTDSVAPIITKPAEGQSVPCNSDTETAFFTFLNAHGGAVAVDTCQPADSLVWSNNFITDAPESCGAVAVTFTVTDGCGSFASTTATFAVIDSVGPSINPSAQNQTAECDGTGNILEYSTWLSTHAGANAVDICAVNLQWTNDAPITGPTQCGSQKVTFTVSDNCGNHANSTAYFIVVDTLDPLIDPQAQSKVVECDGTGNTIELNAWLASHAGASAGDLCTPSIALAWIYSITATDFDSITCTNFTEYTFKVADICGNFGITTAAFGITDSDPPVITVSASDITLECDGTGNTDGINQWLDDNGGARADDICDNDITWTNTFPGEIPEGCSLQIITFTATDDCGNSNNTFGTLFIVDSVAPVFTFFPPNLTISCDSASDPTGTGYPIAFDQCSGGLTPFITYIDTEFDEDIDPEFPLCPGDHVIDRTWTVTDLCGNINSQVQEITVQIVRDLGGCDDSDCTCDNECCPEPESSDCLASDCLPQACTPVFCKAAPCVCNGQTRSINEFVPANQFRAPAQQCEPVYIYVNDDADDDGESVSAVSIPNTNVQKDKNMLITSKQLDQNDIARMKNRKVQKPVKEEEGIFSKIFKSIY